MFLATFAVSANNSKNPFFSQWEFAAQAAKYKYTEPGIMQDKGYLYGVYISLLPAANHFWQLKIDCDFLTGTLQYKGGYQDGTPLVADTSDYIITLRALLYKSFYLLHAFRAAPYAGIAYRYLNDMVEATGAYEREIKYVYVPLGLELNFPFIARSIIGIIAEYNWFLRGDVDSHFENLSPTLPTLHHKQTSGYGIAAYLPITFLDREARFTIMPYFMYWDIDSSDVQRGFYEPANDTVLIGLKLMFGV